MKYRITKEITRLASLNEGESMKVGEMKKEARFLRQKTQDMFDTPSCSSFFLTQNPSQGTDFTEAIEQLKR